MHAEVVAQVYRLARQTKAKKTLSFTNTRDEDLADLYAAIKHNEDDDNPAHVHDDLTGVWMEKTKTT